LPFGKAGRPFWRAQSLGDLNARRVLVEGTTYRYEETPLFARMKQRFLAGMFCTTSALLLLAGPLQAQFGGVQQQLRIPGGLSPLHHVGRILRQQQDALQDDSQRLANLIGSLQQNGLQQPNGLQLQIGVTPNDVVRALRREHKTLKAALQQSTALLNVLQPQNGMQPLLGLQPLNGRPLPNGLQPPIGLPQRNGLQPPIGLPIQNGLPLPNGMPLPNGLQPQIGMPLQNGFQQQFGGQQLNTLVTGLQQQQTALQAAFQQADSLLSAIRQNGVQQDGLLLGLQQQQIAVQTALQQTTALLNALPAQAQRRDRR
jgi:hypothetical protein